MWVVVVGIERGFRRGGVRDPSGRVRQVLVMI